MIKKKSIIINKRSHTELKKLASEHNRSIGKFTEDMVLFFKQTGTDPQAIKGKSASEMIKVIDKRIVSFFKTQERDILQPIDLQIRENNELLKKLIERLNAVFNRTK